MVGKFVISTGTSPVKQGVGDTTGEKGLAGSHIPEQQQPVFVLISFLPVLHIGAGFVHQGILAVCRWQRCSRTDSGLAGPGPSGA